MRESLGHKTQTIARLHHEYAGILYDKCLRILGDKAEAEDAVQETFINAFRAFETFYRGDCYLPWLYQIATNACLNILRARKRKGATPVESLEFVQEIPIDNVQVLYIRGVLRRLVGEIDARSQQIFVYHYLDGMNQGEIAELLGISRRAVVKRLTALRAKAQDIIGDVKL